MTVEERANHDLASLRRWAGKLRRVANIWDSSELDARDRQAFPLEWDNVIGRLAKVEALARDGMLRPSTIGELRSVADELAALMPTMQRLGLHAPEAEALARAQSVTAA